MADALFKKIEIVGTSSKSLTEAIANAIKQVAPTAGDMKWFEVVEQRGAIADGEVTQYQVTLRVGIRVE